MSEMATLKIGIIGCGVIASAHASALQGLREAGLADVEVAVVHDSDRARAGRFARYFGAVTADSMDELATASDIVYVCTPTGGHPEAVRAAAAANRPIFCEKPLARNLDEAVSLAKLASESGVPVQVGLVLRTAPVFCRLSELVASGRYGQPMAVIARDDQFFPIEGHYASTWRSDVAVAGGGALLEHSIHDVDILQACFGQVESASASSRMLAGHDGIEDCVSALLSVASGVPISLVSVWHRVLSRPSTRRVEVLLEEAFVSLEDDFAGPLTVQTSEGVEIVACPPPPWVLDVPLPVGPVGLAVRPYVEENRGFIDCVTQARAPSPGLDEALAAHRVVDACYRSAAAGGVPVSPAS
jgi:predicted dehydrogenase